MPVSISRIACLIWLCAISLQCQHWFLRLDTGMEYSHTAVVLRRVVECTRVLHVRDFDEYLQFPFLVLTCFFFNVGSSEARCWPLPEPRP